MLRNTLSYNFIILITISYITFITAIPICTEDVEYLNSRLSYHIKRFECIIRSKTVSTQHALFLEDLVSRFAKALASDNPMAKNDLLEDYMLELDASLAFYLQQKLDEEYLNQQIAIEVWYLRELRDQFAEHLKNELDQSLEKYELTSRAETLEDKFNLFANIVENYSSELIAILEADPEHEAVVNAHLNYLKMYLNYLLQNELSENYVSKVKTLLLEVQQGLDKGDYEQKVHILDRFDDLNTKFGRYLDYKINEFDTDTFCVL